MRKRVLFALGMCAAVLLGDVSLSLADQAQTAGSQTSSQQGASLQSPAQQSTPQTQQTEKQRSSPKARSATSPQTTKPTSSPKTQAALNSPQTKQTAGVKAQVARPPVIPPGYRLLTLNEGRAIAQGIAWADDEEGLSPDCSHLVHKLYEQAGHPYSYASSLDLYRGTGPFARVRYAHPGDLVVWRGHAGIVVNPREHSFFSTTSSGARLENYRSTYWRARGYPHFFRYLTKSPLQHATSEASNRTPALQPASQPHASQPAASQRKDPPQN